MQTPLKLKYLFTAWFANGQSYTQNEEDKSTLFDWGSCYTDIEKNIDEIIRFELRDDLNIYAVNLEDGSFEVNGMPFKFYGENEEPLVNLKLVFYRQHRHDFTLERQEISHDIFYRFGWEAERANGEKVSRIMELK